MLENPPEEQNNFRYLDQLIKKCQICITNSDSLDNCVSTARDFNRIPHADAALQQNTQSDAIHLEAEGFRARTCQNILCKKEK